MFKIILGKLGPPLRLHVGLLIKATQPTTGGVERGDMSRFIWEMDTEPSQEAAQIPPARGALRHRHCVTSHKLKKSPDAKLQQKSCSKMQHMCLHLGKFFLK